MQLDQASYLARVHSEAVARRQRLGFGRSPLLLAPPARKPRVNRSSDGRATSYIKLRCDASPFTFEEVVGRRKTKDLADFRRQLYVDVSEKFPSLSLPQIGAIFNRDHTTILSFLKKAGRVTQPNRKVTPEVEERMTQLQVSGASIDEIAAECGVSRTTVGIYLFGWDKPKSTTE